MRSRFRVSRRFRPSLSEQFYTDAASPDRHGASNGFRVAQCGLGMQRPRHHAVLTVTADKGDYVLDNQREDILLWSETGYGFIKHQSQSNPNVWVSLGNPRPAITTATSR
jgi:Bacterial transglutaminase-like cysteine proteinase BTLCP